MVILARSIHRISVEDSFKPVILLSGRNSKQIILGYGLDVFWYNFIFYIDSSHLKGKSYKSGKSSPVRLEIICSLSTGLQCVILLGRERA